MNLFYIIAGLVVLIFGGDWLLKASVNISMRLKISRIVIGMTVVSFATSAPELIVSIKSALDGFPDLALGNVIGSNIANIAFVLGITVCFGSIAVGKSFYTTDWPVMMLASLLLYAFIGFDYVITRVEGIILVSLLILFLVYLLRSKNNQLENLDDLDLDDEIIPLNKTLIFLVLGGVGLWGGSELLIKGAVGLAEQIGISERIIGVTIVSMGTSVPELAASIIAVIKKEKAISLGNLIGSNIFNILAVLGITSIITPIKVGDLQIVTNDIYWMLGISFSIFPLCFIPTKLKFGLKEGLLLLTTYSLFIYFTVFK
ncbi:calcium/sodium antiporter [Wenyingzhuangia aestuarii]|uniref:calcium/sodium antiporter n=1 Tax=Wenyingzhuangia aestuarii TaxID=1647582 RepID=UPI00143A1437|nr:calcium/sodium antiporter [Wenyingzhuangia aestuarii]NJB82739.1 cation:H+ antiporter [Wenyingzhuangia aestuarii]